MSTGRAILSATLSACAALAAEPVQAGPAPAPPRTQVVAGTVPIVPQVADLAQVAKVRFYVSNNQGATWTLAHEAEVAPGATTAPRYEFKAPSDGAYLFATAAVLRSGPAENAPTKGQVPPNALSVIVDTTPPVIGDLQATIDSSTDLNVVLGVTWTISDPHFASASIQVSNDGGRTFLDFPQTQAQDYARLTVMRNRAESGFVVRLVARDQAGNSAASQPRQVDLPADPEQRLDRALGLLPSLAEVQPVAPPPAPASATPAHPAVSTQSRERPAESAGTTPAEPAGQTGTAPTRVAGVSAPLTSSRPVQAPGGAFLRGSAAQAQLDRAREQAASGAVDEAHASYLRALISELAPTAAEEDLGLLRGAGDAAAIAGVAESLPEELRTGLVRVEWGRALLALGRPAEAVAVLSLVARSSDQARPALLLLAQAREAQGRHGEATRIYDHLAQGDDSVAREARLLRGK